MSLRPVSAAAAAFSFALAIAIAENPARATTACATDPTQCLCTLHPTDCFAAVQNAGAAVNDIFRDANGLTGDKLPVYGKLFNQWGGCTPYEVNPGCASTSSPTPTPSYNCPGNYACASLGGASATAAQFVDALDHTAWQPCRLANPALASSGGLTCPADWTCVADQVGGNYLPWNGLVFDLGGPSNKVAVFGTVDHGPQPCESLEYTAFFTDNPHANQLTDIVLHPETTGVDPSKWNRAPLSKVFSWGWFNTRAPDPTDFGASCGDTAQYAAEDDTMVQVFSLPCSVTLRYVALVAGNDGLDFPECTFHSSEAELDAVAGLTASGAGVCPDADHDGYVDCSCPGAPAPPACDCNDSDPTVHPGASEACDATIDQNCDGTVGTACAANTACYQSRCDATCQATPGSCPAGSSCQSTPKGMLCVPASCSGNPCPSGATCSGSACAPSCSGIVCPGAQVCREGQCVDPCAGVTCGASQTCAMGTCLSPCTCFAGDLGCQSLTGTVCDTGNTGQCVQPICKGVACTAGQTCGSSGACGPLCNSGVVCPGGQKCVDPAGCVPLCTGVACSAPDSCDPATGMCVALDAGADSGSFDGGADGGREGGVEGGVEGPDGGMPDAGGDATLGDSGGQEDAASNDATTAGDGAPGSARSGNSGGCGCHAAEARSNHAAVAMFAGILLAGIRRSRRRARG